MKTSSKPSVEIISAEKLQELDSEIEKINGQYWWKQDKQELILKYIHCCICGAVPTLLLRYDLKDEFGSTQKTERLCHYCYKRWILGKGNKIEIQK